ncbi:acyl-CoA N-acyltransferase [Flammula alnicola]|nr:acyl-CoA N-acyltransferase [Flammula alnicola]
MDVPPEPYNINFCFSVPQTLESERIILTPFIPSRHAQLFIDQALLYPEMFRYLPFGPFMDVDDFLTNLIERRVRKDPGYTLFTIYDKTKPPATNEHLGALAGLLGLINSSPANLATEVGFVMVLPPFQRTHIASNAVGLLLHYALDLPSHSDQVTGNDASLGLRRVLWQANVLNKPSIRLAERMGFRKEGVLRWDRVLPVGKDEGGAGNGKEVREGDPRRECVGRDTAMLSLCWDDWEEGAREKLSLILSASIPASSPTSSDPLTVRACSALTLYSPVSNDQALCRIWILQTQQEELPNFSGPREKLGDYLLLQVPNTMLATGLSNHSCPEGL